MMNHHKSYDDVTRHMSFRIDTCCIKNACRGTKIRQFIPASKVARNVWVNYISLQFLDCPDDYLTTPICYNGKGTNFDITMSFPKFDVFKNEL